MSAPLELGPEHIAAQIAAQLGITLAFANLGANGQVNVYLDGDVLQIAVPLANPCGVIAGGVLTLLAQDAGGALILVSGVPRRAEWVNGEGKLVARGTVSDDAHDGNFQVKGGLTAPGETAPTLYAGGLWSIRDLTFN